MESHGDWQHVAVAYDAHDASAQFYVNGFPVEPDAVPEVSEFCACACAVVLALRCFILCRILFPQTVSGTHHALSAEGAPFTIGR
jgi:hypothetical protein